MTSQEAMVFLVANTRSQDFYRLFCGSVRDEPVRHVGRFDADGLSVTERVPYLDVVDGEIRLHYDFGKTESGPNTRWPTIKD